MVGILAHQHLSRLVRLQIEKQMSSTPPVCIDFAAAASLMKNRSRRKSITATNQNGEQNDGKVYTFTRLLPDGATTAAHAASNDSANRYSPRHERPPGQPTPVGCQAISITVVVKINFPHASSQNPLYDFGSFWQGKTIS